MAQQTPMRSNLMLLPFSTKDGLTDVMDHKLKAKDFELFVEPSQRKLQPSYMYTLSLASSSLAEASERRSFFLIESALSWNPKLPKQADRDRN